MEKLKIVIAGAALIGSLGNLSANDMQSKMGNIPIGNVAGSTGNVFPEGISRFVIKSFFSSKDNAYNGDDQVVDSMQRELNVNMTQFLYRYGLGRGFDIRMATSYVKKEQEQSIPMGFMAGKSFKFKNNGLGDSRIMLRYELLNQKQGAPFFLAMGGGIKLPTGSTNQSFSTPIGTKSANETQPLQLGSGSYDYISEIGATKLLPNSRIDAHVMYVLTTEGKNDYEFGNIFKWNLGYSYAINQYFDVQLELDGMHTEKNKYKGTDVDYTGGNFVYITPGIHIIPSKKIDISFGYSHMVYRDNNYDSNSNIGGLSEDHRLDLRIGYNF